MEFLRGAILPICVLVCLCLISPTQLRAQVPQCDNCPQGPPWTIAATVIPADPNGCTFEVDYRYRTSFCNTYDLEIIGIRNWALPCISPFNPGRMVNTALQYLLVTNPMAFPPFHPNKCESTIHSHVSQCLGPNSQANYLTKCGDAICCSKTYLVCIDDNGVRTARIINMSNPDPAPCRSGGTSCFPACEEGY